MHAMQYEFTLPADYPMDVVRDRVARTGHLLDDWTGLGTKAYLIRERGRDGSPVNQYAPFYLWNTLEGMNAFLFGGPFQRPADDFGRPAVRQWTGLAYAEGDAAGVPARTALRRRQPAPEGVPIAEWAARAARTAEQFVEDRGASSAAVAVDTSRWELVHFALFAEEAPPVTDGEVYQVLHVSAPERDRLPRGRQW
ncbi:DUF4865 family protein [Streptomyces sp. NPDC048182]|uniref:DUF4865 family protein n=1 Tax=Streptomyces sp. NPDC048182 TaxID=3365507 RepID=UPI003710E2E7